jgi:RNA-binding protein
MRLKDKAREMEPALRIGKRGLTPGVVSEINFLLERRKLIKVKFLKTALDGKTKREFAAEIAEKTGSELINTVGFTAVLYKKKFK